MDLYHGTSDTSSVTSDGIPLGGRNPTKLVQSSNKSLILLQHEALMLKHKASMNSEAKLFAKYGSGNILVKTIGQESGPPTESPTPVQLIPANAVDISTLTQNLYKVLDGKYFLCRTIAPSYRYSAIESIVEDPNGQQGMRLSLYNYSSLDESSYEDLLEDLPVSQILAIKNPLLKARQNGGFFLKCDNPKNVVFISESMSQQLFSGVNSVNWEGQIPEKWEKFILSTPQTSIEWKNRGNKEFVRLNYVKAVQSYTEALKLVDGIGSVATVQLTCDLLSNRAAAYLKLDCFQTALEDVDKLIEIDPTHFKGLYRKGKALLGLQRFDDAINFLGQALNFANLDSGNQKLFLELLELAQNLLNQKNTGHYDLVKLYKAREVRHSDCADFVGPVKVQKINGGRSGRGLFATKDIKPGQLISATKALHIIFPVQESGGICGLRSCQFVTNQNATPFRQNLIQKIVQKVTLEPSLCRSFYELYAGPNFPIYDAEKNPDVVDLKRLASVCQYNMLVGNTPDFEGGCDRHVPHTKSIGIWILPSCINHRCWDVNAIWTTFGDMLFVRALKEIPIGGEILMSYVDPTHMYEEREKVLKVLGFVCECQLCQIDRDQSTEGQQRMELLKKIKEKEKAYTAFLSFPEHMDMRLMMKDIWDLDKDGRKPNLKSLNPSLAFPLSQLAKFFFMYRKYKKAVSLLIKGHELTTNSALKQMAVDTCFHAITVLLENGKIQEAKNWTETLKKELMTLYGTTEIVKLMLNNCLDVMAENNIFLE